jgi:hypothetical protein
MNSDKGRVKLFIKMFERKNVVHRLYLDFGEFVRRFLVFKLNKD